jgi:hypothetical protein
VGVFEFIVALVLISTAGKVVGQRFARERPRGEIPQVGPAEIERIRETIDDLSGRVMLLEEERDFYKELLESPERQRAILPPRTDHGPSSGDGTP